MLHRTCELLWFTVHHLTHYACSIVHVCCYALWILLCCPIPKRLLWLQAGQRSGMLHWIWVERMTANAISAEAQKWKVGVGLKLPFTCLPSLCTGLFFVPIALFHIWGPLSYRDEARGLPIISIARRPYWGYLYTFASRKGKDMSTVAKFVFKVTEGSGMWTVTKLITAVVKVISYRQLATELN